MFSLHYQGLIQDFLWGGDVHVPSSPNGGSAEIIWSPGTRCHISGYWAFEARWKVHVHHSGIAPCILSVVPRFLNVARMHATLKVREEPGDEARISLCGCTAFRRVVLQLYRQVRYSPSLSYYILLAPVMTLAKLIYWPRNSLVSFLALSLSTCERKTANTESPTSSCESSSLAYCSPHVSVQCCLILAQFIQWTVAPACGQWAQAGCRQYAHTGMILGDWPQVYTSWIVPCTTRCISFTLLL